MLIFETSFVVIIWIVVVMATAYILFILYLFIFQSHKVYFPNQVLIADPGSINLNFDKICLKTEDAIELSSWYIPSNSKRGIILFCHGNVGNISDCLETIQIFNRLGLDVLIFDYRGYGQSSGKPTETGTYRDADAAWQYLLREQRVNPSDIIISGRSLGGAVAAWLACRHNPGAIILEETFTSASDMAANKYPYLPARLISRFSYSTVDYIKEINCPVLVIHSRDDEVVPYNHGKKLYEIAKGPKKLIEITGTHSHGFSASAKLYEEGLDAFISEHFSQGNSR